MRYAEHITSNQIVNSAFEESFNDQNFEQYFVEIDLIKLAEVYLEDHQSNTNKNRENKETSKTLLMNIEI